VVGAGAFTAKCFLAGGGNKTAGRIVLSRGVLQTEDNRWQEAERARFEQALLPHLDAAYNLARWLTRDPHQSEDLVQEAYLRALKSFGGFHGIDGRSWLLAIVRNTCYTWLQQARARQPTAAFDEQIHGATGVAANPVSLLLGKEDRETVRQAVDALPVELREVVVLRELEGLSYKEIADIADIPMGTVMSRLARARERLQQGLTQRAGKERSFDV
jgi:RNA polymerase sigma-70 factor (ECF subfamily)